MDPNQPAPDAEKLRPSIEQTLAARIPDRPRHSGTPHQSATTWDIPGRTVSHRSETETSRGNPKRRNIKYKGVRNQSM